MVESFRKTQKNIAEKPLWAYREIKHSLKFLSFFAHYVSPLYQFDQINFLKEYFPIILSTQGLVYSADFEIEAFQKLQRSTISPWIKRKKILLDLLTQLHLNSIKITKEANNLSVYWKLENRMMKKGAVITSCMLKNAIQLRASDIMILHHLCQKLSGIQYDAAAGQCIQSIEIIRDIEADLRQYEADVASDDFNIYRMFLKAYGNNARQILQQELDTRRSLYLTMTGNLPFGCREKFNELTKRYYNERPKIDVPETI